LIFDKYNFSTTYNPAVSKSIYGVLHELQAILQCDEGHKAPRVSFRKSKTLHDILVRFKLPREIIEGSCKGCGNRFV